MKSKWKGKKLEKTKNERKGRRTEEKRQEEGKPNPAG